MSPTCDTVADTQPAAETATELLPPSQRSAAGEGWGGGSANIPDTTAETTTDLPPPTGDGGGVFPHIANVKTATSAGRPFMADIKKVGYEKKSGMSPTYDTSRYHKKSRRSFPLLRLFPSSPAKRTLRACLESGKICFLVRTGAGKTADILPLPVGEGWGEGSK